MPDGLTCANGEILKKTGANDWDCASDSTGSAVGTVPTSLPLLQSAIWLIGLQPLIHRFLAQLPLPPQGPAQGLLSLEHRATKSAGTNGTYSVNTSQNISYTFEFNF